MPRSPLLRLLRAGVATSISDGLFACILAKFVFDSPIARLWQGVASVLLGKPALEGGLRTAWIGVAMHVCVAFFWSAVFLGLYTYSARIRRANPFVTAAWYGPLIWLVMSCIVIPALLHRPPNITVRWWIQLIGHAIFVGLPIVWGIKSTRDKTA